MANEENDGLDLAAREAAQLEVARRIADETVNDDGGQRFNLNRPLVEDEFENAAPRPERSLGDYARPVYNQGLSSVKPPPIAANNFELKQGLLQTIQNNNTFRGKVNEDPNTHLMDFEDIMNTFQYNGVSKDVVYLRVFSFSLKDDVKQWLHSLPAGSIRTWEDMTKKFLDKYFSASKTRKFIREIYNYCQKETETIFEAWERFKEIPLNTEKNPKETIKVVSLRSGKTLADPVVKARPEVVNKQVEIRAKTKGEEQQGHSSGVQKEIEESRHMPTLPFPQKMKREKLDKCFGRLLEILKQLYVNIPFIEVLTQMAAYAKFLKKILSSKRKLKETTMVMLNAHCSAILQNKIPQKCGDPGSFIIPCSLGSETFDKSLCDSGVSINLMPLSLFRRLDGELGVIKSIPVSLQLVDQTTILPEEIIEDILVRVDKFMFPIDFIVVDMEVKKEVPLILGRPFLFTGRVILDIYEGQLMLRVGNEKVVFQMKRMIKYPSDEASAYSCFKLDVVGELAEKYKFDKLMGDTLERCITQFSTMEDEDHEVKKEAEAIETEDQLVDEEELKKEASKPNVELKVIRTH
ncbi:uncharacterized protein LOC107819768 [Nicotiana tabacum]|uniref:Uncharacterized protein LOC107819768 n=1 Tax=Nicotiana tabacum TaxID=4097 RepID=A0AC58SMQ2_TOBAC